MTSRQSPSFREARREDNGDDSVDPFTVLTSSEANPTQSQPVFAPTAQPDSPVVARTPPSAVGDFGPFVSVSTDCDPLSRELDVPAAGLGSVSAAPSSGTATSTSTATVTTTTQIDARKSTGLGIFGVEASQRTKANEDRVLKELRLFEDTQMATRPAQIVETDLPWWLQLGSSSAGDTGTGGYVEKTAAAKTEDQNEGLLIDIDEPATSSVQSPAVASDATSNLPYQDRPHPQKRSRSRGSHQRKPHTPRATPEGTPPSSSSPSPSTSDEDEHEIAAKRSVHRGGRRSASQPRYPSSQHHHSPSLPPPSSGSSTSLFGAYSTPSRNWFASLLTPTRAVPALPSASSLVKPISVPFGKDETGSGPAGGGAGRGDGDGRGSRRSRMLRRSPTEERLAALVSSLPSTHTEGSINAASMTSSSFVKPSPFAAHTFVPPSGAPGFTGDRDWNTGDFEYEDEFAGVRAGGKKRTMAKGNHVKLVGRKESTLGVLDEALADELRPHLPPLARLPRTWTLLYSLDQDGISLNTLYTNCARAFAIPTSSSNSKSSAIFGEVLVESGSTSSIRAPPPGSDGLGMVFAVKDGEGDVFGAWIAEGVRLSHGSYYGGGDAFLFSAHKGPDGDANVYKWTGRNNFVALCDPESISFGGGDGHYGLYLDASLLQGTTHRCPTFDNEPLAKGEKVGGMVTFDCMGVEVWGVGG